MNFSTVFSYSDPKTALIDKGVLFAIVKREAFTLYTNEREAYRKIALETINEAPVEQIDYYMKDIRFGDATCSLFYNMVIGFFCDGLIDKERFVTIFQVIECDTMERNAIESKRRGMIRDIPRVYREKGLEAINIILASLMPENEVGKKEIISELCAYTEYCEICMKYYPELTTQCLARR